MNEPFPYLRLSVISVFWLSNSSLPSDSSQVIHFPFGQSFLVYLLLFFKVLVSIVLMRTLLGCPPQPVLCCPTHTQHPGPVTNSYPLFPKLPSHSTPSFPRLLRLVAVSPFFLVDNTVGSKSYVAYHYSVLLSYDCDLFGKNQANCSNDNLLYKTRYEFTPTAKNSYIK